MRRRRDRRSALTTIPQAEAATSIAGLQTPAADGRSALPLAAASGSEKFRLLEQRHEANQRQQGGDQHVREISMRSLKRLINQLKEEIARFESRGPVKTEGS